MDALPKLQRDTLISPYDFVKDRNRTRRVVFYGRVSTEHEAQLSAMDNQKEWYRDQAKAHPNWDVVDEYFDEGITGTQAKKRPAFLKMVGDAKAGQFDLIVTREVCRFARNTVDTLVTTRELKNIGVEVYFIEDNIWTMDGDGELRLSLMATLAQEESRKVSERVKAGQHISREKGVVYGSGNILGYDRIPGGSYVINEEQAATVRLIYKMYRENKYGMQKIANELIKLGELTATGTTKWTVSNVGRILKNPTYMGYQAYGKSVSNNYLDQKRINNCNESTYIYKKCDYEPIIPEDEWREVEAIRKSRVHTMANHMRMDPFLGEVPKKLGKNDTHYLWKDLVKCKCGHSMRRNRWHKNEFKDWSYGLQCYSQVNNGSAMKRRRLGADYEYYCDGSMIAEWKLDFMAYEIFQMIFSEKNNKKAINDAIKIIEKCYDSKPADHDIKAADREIYKVKTKITNLVDMRTDGDISKEEYRRRRNIYDDQIMQLEAKRKHIEEEMVPEENKVNLQAIEKSLKKTINLEGPIIKEEYVRQFVPRVQVISKYEYKWIINLSGKEYEPGVDDESEIKMTKSLTFAEARAWRLRNGDYIRNRQWQDLEMDIRII